MQQTRRQCLEALLGAAAVAGFKLDSPASSSSEGNRPFLPGPYRGRVVAVENAACLPP